MPELPEVEALARGLDLLLRDRVVDRLRLFSISALKTFDPPVDSLEGARLTGCSRRGKFLIVHAVDVHLVIHLARAGWVRWSEALNDTKQKLGGPLTAQLRCQDGSGLRITEQGTEKRLALYLVRQPEDVPGMARLGVDCLDSDFSAQTLTKILSSATGTLKSLLADQSLIAGIGNAYSDEILHWARLSPFRKPTSLKAEEIEVLHGAIVEVISGAVKGALGRELGDLKDNKRTSLRVHGRDGQPCPVCGTTVRSVHSASRSFQYCPACQTQGKILADRRLSRLIK